MAGGFEGQLREEVRIESNPILAIERREDHLTSPTEGEFFSNIPRHYYPRSKLAINE
jgi:hypothetical protein